MVFIMSKEVKFQSTLPREERLQLIGQVAFLRIFQSTLPREERPSFFELISDCRDFNPRSHERSDLSTVFANTYFSNISIHAPTRGATFNNGVVTIETTISIHAPTRGATNNSTILSNNQIISIHAPTRGATMQAVLMTVIKTIFQSTLPREERQQYCTKNLFIFIQYRQ